MEIDAIAVSEAARRLAISTRTVHRLIRRGELPSILIGRRRLIRRSSLAEWLAGLEQPPTHLRIGPLAGGRNRVEGHDFAN